MMKPRVSPSCAARSGISSTRRRRPGVYGQRSGRNGSLIHGSGRRRPRGVRLAPGDIHGDSVSAAASVGRAEPVSRGEAHRGGRRIQEHNARDAGNAPAALSRAARRREVGQHLVREPLWNVRSVSSGDSCLRRGYRERRGGFGNAARLHKMSYRLRASAGPRCSLTRLKRVFVVTPRRHCHPASRRHAEFAPASPAPPATIATARRKNSFVSRAAPRPTSGILFRSSPARGSRAHELQPAPRKRIHNTSTAAWDQLSARIDIRRTRQKRTGLPNDAAYYGHKSKVAASRRTKSEGRTNPSREKDRE